MSRREHTLKEYEQILKKNVGKKELKCPRCENAEEFMVNELGYGFCKNAMRE